ncbi:MAG TPA: hypothetical protein VMV95_01930 [Bacillota bacterium]|nr:hypothetical protein [Bacillota bacterium]
MSKENPGKSLVYIPCGAKINTKNKDMSPPETKYEKRRAVFRREEVNKIAKGKYGEEF